jgi:hypothetical protein
MSTDVPGFDAALDVAAEPAGIIRQTVTQALSVWLDEVAACGVTDLKTFAAGVRKFEPPAPQP